MKNQYINIFGYIFLLISIIFPLGTQAEEKKCLEREICLDDPISKIRHWPWKEVEFKDKCDAANFGILRHTEFIDQNDRGYVTKNVVFSKTTGAVYNFQVTLEFPGEGKTLKQLLEETKSNEQWKNGSFSVTEDMLIVDIKKENIIESMVIMNNYCPKPNDMYTDRTCVPGDKNYRYAVSLKVYDLEESDNMKQKLIKCRKLN